MAATPVVSVCIITGGRLDALDACLASLEAQLDAPAWELLVCSNGGPDVSEVVRARFPDAIVGRMERTRLGRARNFLVHRAIGEWLLFLDDDVTVKKDLLRRVADLGAAHPDVAVLGGPNGTPRRSSRFQIVQGAVLASIVTSGPVRRRYGAHPAGPADERFFTLCNLAVRREAMLPFPDELVGAEENAVLIEMSRQGLAMHYDPGLLAFHERRPALRSFAVQMFKYGRGRGQLVRRRPATLRPSYAAAPALVLGLPALLALSLMTPLALLPTALYLAAVGLGGARVGWGMRRLSAAVLATALILVVHFCYGAGVLRGLVDRPRRSIHRHVPSWDDGPADAEAPTESRSLAR